MESEEIYRPCGRCSCASEKINVGDDYFYYGSLHFKAILCDRNNVFFLPLVDFCKA